jgi:hypothetical protein
MEWGVPPNLSSVYGCCEFRPKTLISAWLVWVVPTNIVLACPEWAVAKEVDFSIDGIGGSLKASLSIAVVGCGQTV